MHAQECSHSLYVADREGAAVHRFSMDTRQHEGALFFVQSYQPYYGPQAVLLHTLHPHQPCC